MEDQPAQARSMTNLDLSNWDIKGIRVLKQEVQSAAEQGKYLFIWDRLGTVATFFRFQGTLCEFDTLVQGADSGHRTDKQACESLRDDMLMSQRAGTNFCIDIGETTPNFTNRFNDPDVFPSEQVFNRPAWFEMNKNDVCHS